MVLIHKREVIPTVLAWWLLYPTERDRLDVGAKRLCAVDRCVKVGGFKNKEQHLQTHIPNEAI